MAQNDNEFMKRKKQAILLEINVTKYNTLELLECQITKKLAKGMKELQNILEDMDKTK